MVAGWKCQTNIRLENLRGRMTKGIKEQNIELHHCPQYKRCSCCLSIIRTTSSLRLAPGVNTYLIVGSKDEKDPRPVLKKE